MMQVGKLVKVYVYLKGRRIEVEPDEARALLARLKAALGDYPPAQPVFIPVPQPYPDTVSPTPHWPLPTVWCGPVAP